MKFKKIVITLLFVVISSFHVTKVFASSNTLDSITMNIDIQNDGSAKITETWSGTFVEGTENYKCWYNMAESFIRDFQVSDETGTVYEYVNDWDVDANREQKKNKCGIAQPESHDYELCYGIGDYGYHEYTMTYTITDFVMQYNDCQGFNYQLISSDMDPAPKYFEIKIVSDYPFYDENSDIYGFGYEGQVVFDDQGAIYMANRDMDTGTIGDVHYANILCKVEGNPYTSAKKVNDDFADVLKDAKKGSSYQDDHAWIIALIIIGIALIAIISGTIFVWLYIRKRKKYVGYGLKFSDGQNELIKKSDVDYFRDIPCHKDIFYFYFIADKMNMIDQDERGGIVSALLLKWIRDGLIQFEKVGESGWFKKEKFEIDFSQVSSFDNELENKMLDYFKQASGSNKILENKEFEKWCQKHYEKVESWFDKIIKSEERRLRDCGLAKKETTYKTFLGIKIPSTKTVYDVSIREDMKQVIGFQKFLKEFSLIDEKEVIEVKRWEEYLIFASVLSMADQVEKQLGKMCPEFNEQSRINGAYTGYATRRFVYSGIKSASQAYAAAHSSSSSGGGGASSFGGGGGGFSGGGGGGSR